MAHSATGKNNVHVHGGLILEQDKNSRSVLSPRPRKIKRVEERKYKRIQVRFGPESPQFSIQAVQISTRGLFLATNSPIYAPGSKVVIEISTPKGKFIVSAIVRHSKKVPHFLLRHERPGMGVEFISIPEEVREYLSAL